MTGATGPQWRDVHDLVQESKRDILDAIDGLREVLGDHETRIRSIENTAGERRGSQATTAFFLTLPGRLVALAASGATLVLTLLGVWAAMGKLS